MKRKNKSKNEYERTNYEYVWGLAKTVAGVAKDSLESLGWLPYEIDNFNGVLTTLLQRNKSILGIILVSSVFMIRVFETDEDLVRTLIDIKMTNVFMDVLTETLDEALDTHADSDMEESSDDD